MASVNIKPLEDKILVQANEAETTTASGLVIPDTAKEKPQEGEVLAVGPGRFEDGQRLPLDIQVGDKVIYSKYGGTEVKYDGQEYLLLSARDVLAVEVDDQAGRPHARLSSGGGAGHHGERLDRKVHQRRIQGAVADAIGADRTGIRISPGHMFNDIADADPVAQAANQVELALALEAAGCFALVDRMEGGREAIEGLGVPVEALFTRRDFLG